MKKNPNIAFFGTPHRAVIVLETLKQSGIVPKLIITQPDRPQGRKLVITPPAVKTWAQKEKIPFLQPENLEDQTFIQTLKEGNFDVFVVVAYGKILRQNILNIPKHGCLNLHASLLPKLRGSSPIETAILTDEKKTGVTIILMDNLMDHGPIVVEKEVELSSWPISLEELSKILLESGAELMAQTIPLWLDGKIKPLEQNHAEATTAKKIKKEDGLIDLSDDPYKNYLKFLAFREWPTTYFFLEKDKKKTRVIITDAMYENGLFVIKKVIPEGKKETSLFSLYPRQTP